MRCCGGHAVACYGLRVLCILPVLAYLLASPVHLERPAAPTSITVPEVRAVLARAHVDALGYAPSRARLSLLVAQVRLEGLALPGKNLGGLEYVAGRPWVRVDRRTRLRAFDTYDAAARAYLRLLRDRCAGALHAMDGGDPAEVARRLKMCGYYGTEQAWYRDGLRALRAP